MKAKNFNDLPSEELVAQVTGEKLSIARSISEAFGCMKLLVHHETLLPGRRASRPHRHSLKEEIFIVLSGMPSLWLDGRTEQLRPGDAVGLRPEEGARMIINESDEAAEILTIGTDEVNDVVEFEEQ